MKTTLFLIHRSVAFLTPAVVLGNVVGGMAFIMAPIGLLALLTLPTHPDQKGHSRSDQQP
jgi:hypothetical protein